VLCALTVCHDNSANTSQIHSDKDKHGIDWLSITPEKNSPVRTQTSVVPFQRAVQKEIGKGIKLTERRRKLIPQVYAHLKEQFVTCNEEDTDGWSS